MASVQAKVVVLLYLPMVLNNIEGAHSDTESNLQTSSTMSRRKWITGTAAAGLMLATPNLALGDQEEEVDNGVIKAEEPPPEILSRVTKITVDGVELKIPDPDIPLPYLYYMLKDDRVTAAFLKKHLEFELANGAVEYLREFRKSPEQFLKDGKGDCNDYAEFWCNVWAANGRQNIRLVSLWPKERITNSPLGMFKDQSWHMVATCDSPDKKEQVSHSVGSNHACQNFAHLSRYCTNCEMTYLPFGGDMAWKPSKGANGLSKLGEKITSSRAHPESLAPEIELISDPTGATLRRILQAASRTLKRR